MVTTRQTVLQSVTPTPFKILEICFRKETVEDGTVVGFGYHRTAIEPGIPARAQMAAVSSHLAGMGYPAIDNADMATIENAVAKEHTHEVITTYRARQEAESKKREEA